MLLEKKKGTLGSPFFMIMNNVILLLSHITGQCSVDAGF